MMSALTDELGMTEMWRYTHTTTLQMMQHGNHARGPSS